MNMFADLFSFASPGVTRFCRRFWCEPCLEANWRDVAESREAHVMVAWDSRRRKKMCTMQLWAAVTLFR